MDDYYSQANYDQLTLDSLTYQYGIQTFAEASARATITYGVSESGNTATREVTLGSVTDELGETKSYLSFQANANDCSESDPILTDLNISTPKVNFQVCDSCDPSTSIYVSDPLTPKCVPCSVTDRGQLDESHSCYYLPVANEDLPVGNPVLVNVGGWIGAPLAYYESYCQEFFDGEYLSTPFPGEMEVRWTYHYTCGANKTTESRTVVTGIYRCGLDETRTELVSEWQPTPEEDFVNASCDGVHFEKVTAPNL